MWCMQYILRRAVQVSFICLPIIIYPQAAELGIVDSVGELYSIWRIENQRGSIRPWSRRPVASHCTAYNFSDHERTLKKDA